MNDTDQAITMMLQDNAALIGKCERLAEENERLRGTCHETIINHYWRGCDSCGYIWEFMYGIGKCERPHYCPNCGRRVDA